MGNIKQAVDFVLKQEDATLAGHVTTIRGDHGGRTRFGLTERFHPQLAESGYFDEAKVGREDALRIAEETYEQEYAVKLHLSEIADPALMVAMLSFAINDGPEEGARLLQLALVHCGAQIGCDGVIGEQTVAAANATNPDALLDAYVSVQTDFYHHICLHNPSQIEFLAGWLNRAKSVAVAAKKLRSTSAPAAPAAAAPAPEGEESPVMPESDAA